MITLCQFKPNWNLLNASPFCMKVELFLKINKINYQIDDSMKAIISAPKGKMPYITDSKVKISDSEFILEHLIQKYNLKIDKHLSQEQSSIQYAFIKMLEEHLYWCMVYSRWVDNLQTIKKAFFGNNKILPYFVRKKLLKQLKGQGMGLHSQDGVYHIGCNIFDKLSDFLSKKKFMMGDKISTLDIVFYSFATNIIDAPIESPLKESASKHKNIINYMKMFKKTYRL